MDGVALALDVEPQLRRLLLDDACHVEVHGRLQRRRERRGERHAAAGRHHARGRLKLEHRPPPGGRHELGRRAVAVLVKCKFKRQRLSIDERHDRAAARAADKRLPKVERRPVKEHARLRHEAGHQERHLDVVLGDAERPERLCGRIAAWHVLKRHLELAAAVDDAAAREAFERPRRVVGAARVRCGWDPLKRVADRRRVEHHEASRVAHAHAQRRNLHHARRRVQRLHRARRPRHLWVAAPARQVVRLGQVKVAPRAQNAAVQLARKRWHAVAQVRDVRHQQARAVLHLGRRELDRDRHALAGRHSAAWRADRVEPTGVGGRPVGGEHAEAEVHARRAGVLEWEGKGARLEHGRRLEADWLRVAVKRSVVR
eukprot:344367-Chlamydomonas_euryale.AAC.1